MSQQELVVSADGHILEPTDLFKTRLPRQLRDRGVWEEDFEIEPLVEGGARDLPPAAHARLRRLDHLALPADRRPHARRRPRAHHRRHGRSTGSTSRSCIPNLSLFGLYSDDHELSMGHARVYNDYVIERFAPLLLQAGADRTRSRSPTSLTPSPRSNASLPAASGRSCCRRPHRCTTTRATLDPVWDAASANGLQIFFHTQTGGVKVNDPSSTTLRVVMENAQQVNQPMTEKAAAKRMITQAIYSTLVPQQIICELVGGGVPERYPGPAFLADRVQRPLARVARRRDGQVLGDRHRAGRRLVARGLGRHPAADRSAQHGAALPAEREVAVSADAERVREAPVPRVVPGRSGRRRLPPHHRGVDDRVGQRLPARRRHFPRQP